MLEYVTYTTGHGRGIVTLRSGKILEHRLPADMMFAPEGAREDVASKHAGLARLLESYFGSGTCIGPGYDLDFADVSDFCRVVYGRVRQLAFGETSSYGEIAADIGCASARAVGGALAANPIPLFVPCHRVLASGGAIGGWSGPAGMKRAMLALEGVTCAG